MKLYNPFFRIKELENKIDSLLQDQKESKLIFTVKDQNIKILEGKIRKLKTDIEKCHKRNNRLLGEIMQLKKESFSLKKNNVVFVNNT